MRRARVSILTALTTVAALVAGCGGTGAQQPAPAASAPPSGATTASPSTRPSPDHPAWGSGPVTVVRHPVVPPVPVVTRVRSAAHSAEGFDRIVFDIDGPQPGYTVRYVDQVRADPSDRVLSVPGRRHLLVVLAPAQAHRESGAATISGVHRLGLPMMRSYAIVGDFEGHVSVAIGVDDVAGFRVGELPGRIYVDVAA
jgi:hypothetical protein